MQEKLSVQKGPAALACVHFDCLSQHEHRRRCDLPPDYSGSHNWVTQHTINHVLHMRPCSLLPPGANASPSAALSPSYASLNQCALRDQIVDLHHRRPTRAQSRWSVAPDRCSNASSSFASFAGTLKSRASQKNKVARQSALPGRGDRKRAYARSTENLPAPVKSRVT